MSDRSDLILEKIQDLKEYHGDKLATLVENTRDIREDLNQHMDRTRAVEKSNELLTQLHLDNQKRIETNESQIKTTSEKVVVLEGPRNARKYLVVAMKGLGIVAVGILSVLKLIDYIK